MNDRTATERKVRRVVKLLILAPIIFFIFVVGFGQAVLHLWNWLMPTLFGLPVITFWQAWGLMALSWILFGGWRGFGGPSRHSRRGAFEYMQRWQAMTPEERAAFRAGLRTDPVRRCGEPSGASGGAGAAPPEL
jgi:hypothetical protein